MRTIPRVFIVGGAIASTCAAMPATATEALEEIVVTAERRAVSLQDVGVAVSVKTGEELSRAGKYSLDDILQAIPGVSGATLGTGVNVGSDTPAAGLAIRGIQTNDQGSSFFLAPISTTALYVDNVYNGLGGSYDLERVEVLRGPQGTLYGLSATGGMIATHTRNPSLDAFGGEVSVLAGNYNLRQYTGALNIPLGDTFAIRLSGNRYERDGYESREGGRIGTTDFRVKALYQPSEDISLLVGAAMQNNNINSGGAAYRRTGPLTITNTSQLSPGAYQKIRVPILSSDVNVRQYWAELNWHFAGMTLTYLPSYRSFEKAGRQVIGGGTFFGEINVPEDNFITHELRLTSDVNNWVSWQAGVVHYKNEAKDFKNAISLPNGTPNTYRLQDRDVTDLGAFSEATFSFTDQTRLTAGLRYDQTKLASNIEFRRYATATSFIADTVSGDEGKMKSNSLTYKLRLEHDWSMDKKVYAMVSSGFAPGDINVTTSTTGGIPRIDTYRYVSEELVSYELGSKNRFLDGRVQVNAAVFFNDYQGYHEQVFDQTDPTNQKVETIPVQVKGAEFESLFQVTDQTRLGLNLAYTDAVYHNPSSDFAVTAVKEEVPDVPPFTGSLLVDHDLPFANDSVLSLHAEGNYKSNYDTQTLTVAQNAAGGERFIQPGDWWTINVSGNYRLKSGLYFNAYVRNVGDTRKVTAGTIRGLSPYVYAGPAGWTENDLFISEPRTYGLRIGYQF